MPVITPPLTLLASNGVFTVTKIILDSTLVFNNGTLYATTGNPGGGGTNPGDGETDYDAGTF